MIQKYVSSSGIKELEEQEIKFVHESMMRFLKQVPMTGLVRRQAFTVEELKSLIGKQRVIEIYNMYANYETLKNFIENPSIHILEEQLQYDENDEVRRYTIVNLEITVIFEVKRVTWDRYPEIRFADCNIKIINKPYEQVKIEEGLQRLLETKKAELGRLINTEEIYYEMLQGDIEIGEIEVEEEFIINLDKLIDVTKNKDRYSKPELDKSMKFVVEVYLKSSQHKVKEKTSINNEVIQMVHVIELIENIIQTEKVSDIMTFLKVSHI